MRIVVLAGGLSVERDVSLSSGSDICRALLKRGHEAVLIDQFMGYECDPADLESVFSIPGANLGIAAAIKTVEPDLNAIKASRPDQSSCMLGPNVIDLCRMADITLLALHGGIGENGQLQATFDVLGIKYTGPNYVGSAIAMDKGIAKQLFQKNNIPTPGGTWIRKEHRDITLSEIGLELPVVVKPSCGGSSIGVYIPTTEDEYKDAIDKAFQYEDEVVIEPYIKGREFACGYIDGVALPVIEIIPKTGFFDYANKYQADLTQEICPANIDEETSRRMQDATIAACQVLKLDVYSRADFLLTDEGEIYCLEVNTLPGMTPTSLLPQEAAAAGIEYGELCELIIEKSLARYKESEKS
ncbi:MAG: D-alanine--D-alanine ligase [Eubacteriales bacterium]